MKNARHYWSNHVTAVRSQGIATSAYARQHDLSLASLYYWQRKLSSAPTTRATTAAAPKHLGKFVALRVSDTVPDMAPSAWRCTLVLAGGIRLEMPALPDPQWLAAVGRSAQGAH